MEWFINMNSSHIIAGVLNRCLHILDLCKLRHLWTVPRLPFLFVDDPPDEQRAAHWWCIQLGKVMTGFSLIQTWILCRFSVLQGCNHNVKNILFLSLFFFLMPELIKSNLCCPQSQTCRRDSGSKFNPLPSEWDRVHSLGVSSQEPWILCPHVWPLRGVWTHAGMCH